MHKNFPADSGMRLLNWLCVCLILLACASVSQAQAVLDAPVLISNKTSTQALAVNPMTSRGIRLPEASDIVLPAGEDTRVTLFVTNLDLLDDEGANAFRADAQNALGRRYNLPVESLVPIEGLEWIYAVTLRLNPQLGDAGDVLVRLNWRGMSSNRVRLAIGHSGGGPKDDPGAVPTPARLSPPQPELRVEQRVSAPFLGDNVRFLEQATFGPTFESEFRLRRLGIRRWLEEEMADKFDAGGNPRYSSIPYPTLPLQLTNPPAGCAVGSACFRDNYTMYKLQNWMYQEALYSEDQQLRRRVSWALSQIMVVSGRDTPQPSYMLPYIQILDRHAFGDFRALLKEITLNPAMGNYLDMIRSTSANPNENYAREILQLFSVGLDMLKQDGTPRLDANGNRIPTYNQDVVNGFTKVFTGWTLQPPMAPGIPNYISPLRNIASDHDTGTKLLMSYPGAISTIPAGLTAEQDLELALDNVFFHPNVGPFIGKLLIQHLVTSNPTPAYVQRVAQVFENNGRGLRGDMKSVIAAILLDPEARGNIKTDPDYGHLREPFLYVVNLLRPLDPRSSNRSTISDGVINGLTFPLDQDVFNPPSVFNYYPPDYLVPNTTIYGPEYAILTTGTALRRPNVVNQMVFTTAGIPPAGTNIPSGTSISVARLQTLLSTDPSGGQLVDVLNKLMLHGTMSPAMRTSILQAVQAVPSADLLKRTRTAVYLVATSSQYQVQR